MVLEELHKGSTSLWGFVIRRVLKGVEGPSELIVM